MPEPNERPIEQLLKSAGATRRGQAGTPEMHPATREVLQTEVRRQYGAEPVKSHHGFSGLLRWLPRVAVFVALGACAWLLWFRDGGVDPMHLAMNPEAASPAVPDEEAVRGMQELPVTVMAPAEVGVEPVGAKKLEPIGASPAAPQPSARVPVARLVGSAVPTQEAPKSVVGADYLKSDRQAMYLGTAAAEDKGAIEQDHDAALASLMASTAAPTGQVSSRGGFELGVSAPRNVAVFRNFTVYTTGNVVRVVDADGSTYAGTIQPVLAQATPGLEARSDMPVAALSEGVTAKDLSGVAGAGEASLVSYRLLASGTNRSLRQPVVFEGELALTKQQLESGRNVFSNTVPPVAGGGLERLRANASRAGSRLTGRAVLGERTDLPVDAVPTTP